MDAYESLIIGVLGLLVPAIGAGFVWLINKIVSTSKEAVKELRTALTKAEKDRDMWRDRAYECGWRAKK